MDILLAFCAWDWCWRRLSYFCSNSGGEVAFEEARTTTGLDFLQSRLGKMIVRFRHPTRSNTHFFSCNTDISIAQGNLTGALVTLIILACFGPALYGEGKYGQLDAIWRLQIGLALIPALATLYPRLTMPEGRKYLESRELNRARRPELVHSRLSRRSRKSRGESVELVTSDGTRSRRANRCRTRRDRGTRPQT